MCEVSVIVCTFNRARLLTGLLESAVCLSPVPSWELVVIDNNSSDRTRQVAGAFAGCLPLKYYREDRRGKCVALNRGVAVSRGALLLFCDDDVCLDPDWLHSFVEAARRNPGAGWFGGRVLPSFPSGRPVWLRDDCLPALSGHFISYDLGTDCRPYCAADKLPIGASMAVRRRTFAAVGCFREDLGPRGNRRGVGDDTDLVTRAIAAAIPGYYVGSAVCRHYVHPDRLRFRSFIEYGISKGSNQYRMGVEGKRSGSVRRMADQLARSLFQALKGRGDRARICLVNIGIEIGRLRASRATASLF